MADEDLSQRLRDEIVEVEKLLDEAKSTFDRLRLDVEQLKGRLKALKDLAASLDRDRDNKEK
jgi:chromosome segregation ATPase